MKRQEVLIPTGEVQRQMEICRQLAQHNAKAGGQPLALVDTYGCQQNEADSEQIRGMLREMGYAFTEDTSVADVIVINTCAIREHAELRVLGNVGALTHTKRRKMNLICAAVYAAMLAAFAVGYSFSGSLNIGAWLYVMLALFFGNMVYCIYMVKKEMKKRKRMLETMAATDMVPFLRYARASVMMLLLTAVSMPFAVLSTKSLYIVGPVGLLVLLFFVVNFVAFGNCYVPTEELLDMERSNNETDDEDDADDEQTTAESCARQSAADCDQSAQRLSAERTAFIQAALNK